MVRPSFAAALVFAVAVPGAAAVRVVTEVIAPNLTLVPNMETGATDGLYIRNAGIPTYGLSGIAIDTDDIRAHGRDERVNVLAFERAQEFSYRLLQTLTTPVTS